MRASGFSVMIMIISITISNLNQKKNSPSFTMPTSMTIMEVRFRARHQSGSQPSGYFLAYLPSRSSKRARLTALASLLRVLRVGSFALHRSQHVTLDWNWIVAGGSSVFESQNVNIFGPDGPPLIIHHVAPFQLDQTTRSCRTRAEWLSERIYCDSPVLH